MNNFFKSTTFKVLLAVAIVLICATVLATVVGGKTSPLTNVVDFITAPLQNVASYFSEKLDGVTGGFISSDAYRDRVAELEQQVADYQAQLVDYEKTKKQQYCRNKPYNNIFRTYDICRIFLMVHILRNTKRCRYSSLHHSFRYGNWLVSCYAC